MKNMKANKQQRTYQRPETEIIHVELEQMVCVSGRARYDIGTEDGGYKKTGDVHVHTTPGDGPGIAGGKRWGAVDFDEEWADNPWGE